MLSKRSCLEEKSDLSCLAQLQVERAVLDLCLDPSDSYLAAVAVDISSIENNVSSSVRLYEVGRQRPAAGDDDDDDDGVADEVSWLCVLRLYWHCGHCVDAHLQYAGSGWKLAVMTMMMTVQLMR
jgi:hypothetical protein